MAPPEFRGYGLTGFEKSLRRVLRRLCLAVGFRGKKGSEKGSYRRGSKKGLPREGPQKAATRLFESTTPFACPLLDPLKSGKKPKGNN